MKSEQVILGMTEHNQRPEILKDYLKDNQFTSVEENVLMQWDNEIYGNMHIICFDRNKVFIYCEETDQVYHVFLLDNVTKKELKSIPYYMRIQCSIISIDGKQYLDFVFNIQSQFDSSMHNCEKLYEHIYDIIKQNPMMLSRCFTYSKRSLDEDKFSTIFLDFVGPLSPLSMDVDQLESCLRLCYLVWNNDVVDSIGLPHMENEDIVLFLKERKKKYFSNINRVLVDYEIIYDSDGFEIITKSCPPKKLIV